MFKRVDAKRWFILFIVFSTGFVALFIFVIYLFDPYFQYRVRDNTYILNSVYNGPGLIKNYDYDTLVLGSSMTQNFNMDVMRRELGGSPLHIGISGMNCEDVKELIRLANKTEKASRYYICVDLPEFTRTEESSIPKYLLEDSVLSKLQYSLAYESWFRFMPADLGVCLLKTAGYELPQEYYYKMSIDYLEDWSHDYTFSEEAVLNNYKAKLYRTSTIETDGLLDRMIQNMDAYAEEFHDNDASYSFFFPPYSALYWCDAKEQGYYDIYVLAKEYFIQKITELGHRVYDFQSEEFTMDLNNYKDTTHYSSEINNWMVRAFAAGECLVTPKNYYIYRDALQGNTERFREQYDTLFGEKTLR